MISSSSSSTFVLFVLLYIIKIVIAQTTTSNDPSLVFLRSSKAPFPSPVESTRFTDDYSFYHESATVFTLANSLSFPPSATSSRTIRATFDLLSPSSSTSSLQSDNYYPDLDAIAKALKVEKITEEGAEWIEKLNKTLSEKIAAATNDNGTADKSLTTNDEKDRILRSLIDEEEQQMKDNNNNNKKRLRTSLDFHVTWVLHLVNRDTWAEFLRSHANDIDLTLVDDSVRIVNGESIISSRVSESTGRESIPWSRDYFAKSDEWDLMTEQERAALPRDFPAFFPPSNYRTLCTNLPSLKSYTVGTLPGDLNDFYENERRKNEEKMSQQTDNNTNTENSTATANSTINSTADIDNTTNNNSTTSTATTQTPGPSQTTPAPSPSSHTSKLSRTVDIDTSRIRGDEFSLLLSRCVWSTVVSESYNKVATSKKLLKREFDPATNGSKYIPSEVLDKATRIRKLANLTKFVFESKAISAAASVDIAYAVGLPSGSKVGGNSLFVTQTLESQFAVELVTGIIYMCLGVAATLWLYLRNEVLTDEAEKQTKQRHDDHGSSAVVPHNSSSQSINTHHRQFIMLKRKRSRGAPVPPAALSLKHHRNSSDEEENSNNNEHDHQNGETSKNQHSATALSTAAAASAFDPAFAQHEIDRIQKIRRPPQFVFLAIYTLIGRGVIAVFTIASAQQSLAGERISALEIVADAFVNIAYMFDMFSILWLCTGASVTRKSISTFERQIWFVIMVGLFIFGTLSSVCARTRAPFDIVDSLTESTSAFGINCDTIFVVQASYKIVASVIAVIVLFYQENVILKMLTDCRAKSGYNTTSSRSFLSSSSDDEGEDENSKNSSSEDSDDSTPEKKQKAKQRRTLAAADEDRFSNKEEMSEIRTKGVAHEDDGKNSNCDNNTNCKRPHHLRPFRLLPLCTIDMWLRLRDFKYVYLIVSLLPIISAIGEEAYTAFGSNLWLTLVEKMISVFVELLILYYFYDVAEHRR